MIAWFEITMVNCRLLPLSVVELSPHLFISNKSQESHGIIQKHLQDVQISLQDSCYPSNASLAPLSSSGWLMLLESYAGYL